MAPWIPRVCPSIRPLCAGGGNIRTSSIWFTSEQLCPRSGRYTCSGHKMGAVESCCIKRSDGTKAVERSISKFPKVRLCTSKRHCSGGAAPRGHGVCDQWHPSTPLKGQDNACSLGLHHPPDQLAPTVDPHSALQLISSPPVLLVACKPLPHLPLLCTLWSGGCHFTRHCKREQLPPKP